MAYSVASSDMQFISLALPITPAPYPGHASDEELSFITNSLVYSLPLYAIGVSYITIALASLLKRLARRIPRYLPTSVLDSTPAWSGQWEGGAAVRLDRRAGDMTSASPAKPEKSYLANAVDSISPWSTSRSPTPKPGSTSTGGPELATQQGLDHSLSHHTGISSKRYPKDCPLLSARWFYAVDTPKRKPKLLREAPKDAKPLPPPKKFVSFSVHDSWSIETAYQLLVEGGKTNKLVHHNGGQTSGLTNAVADQKENTSINEAGNLKDTRGKSRVPVNEDFLFDVDVETRELAPVYWLGPIYEVRRGSWFYHEGSVLRPCEENLAAQLEEGYLKVMPFRYPKPSDKPMSDTTPMKPGNDPALLATPPRKEEATSDLTKKPPNGDFQTINQHSFDAAVSISKEVSTPNHEPQTYRLFGTYMNSIVTYQDESTAWLSSDGIMSRVSNTVYQRFAGGGYLGGIKLVRGFTEPGKSAKIPEAKSDRSLTPKTSRPPDTNLTRLQLDESQKRVLKRRSAPPSTTTAINDDHDKESEPAGPGIQEGLLNRQISSIATESMDSAGREEAARRSDEKEIQNDYVDHDGEDQSRRLEHLILVTHGIGQRLGMRTESVNFVHDVNVLRQSLKSVYSNSADLQALNAEIDQLPKNCRVQVLPVCWRHLLDFPRQGLKQNRKEHDLGDTLRDDEEYPSLEDITIEGVPFVRSLITDLALDILLYQSAYREHISGIVLRECNRIYRLFLDRNPYFEGKVSLIGHSLGSAILFDLLCRQKEDIKIHASHQHSRNHRNRAQSKRQVKREEKDLSFDFPVEDFYCLGSPIGLFQMLKGRTIAARHSPAAFPAESPMDPDEMDDPFLGASNSASTYSAGEKISSITSLPYTISSPKCAQLYNIFHPSDPISYRLEPLITPAMSSLKPQTLPYTKRGIFGPSTTQGLTGISARVGQSVSGFWSSLSSGIASSLLNRSLGLTADDVSSMAESQRSSSRKSQLSAGTSTNTSSVAVISAVPPLVREDTNERKRQLAESTAAANREGSWANAPTLIDDEIETLYTGFQKRRKSQQNECEQSDNARAEVEEKGKKLRGEELKVRSLNRNGRVDFSIQE